jgi:DNA polymerase eta
VRGVIDASTVEDDDDEVVAISDPKWICPRCSAVFSAPKKVGGVDETSVVALRQEHEDYHFASDLQGGSAGGTPVGASRKGQITSTKVRKKVKSAEGIKAFFTTQTAKPEPP